MYTALFIPCVQYIPFFDATRCTIRKWDEQEDEFAKQLDAEVEKVLLFYLARQGELSNRILSVHQEARTLR